MITNDEQLFLAQDVLIKLDTYIKSLYNTIETTDDLFEVTNLQDIIKETKLIRLGYYGLIAFYTYQGINKNKVENQVIYIVKEEITLADVSNSFYGLPDYAQEIYMANDLSTDILEVNQELIIPKIDNLSKIGGNLEIYKAEIENIIRGY